MPEWFSDLARDKLYINETEWIINRKNWKETQPKYIIIKLLKPNWNQRKKILKQPEESFHLLSIKES